jgi:hypothetical protein
MPWLKEFIRDYVAWTTLDRAIDALTGTTAGKAFLAFLASAVLSALTTAVAHLRALGPAWKYGSVGALVATMLASMVMGFSLLLSKRRTLPRQAARQWAVPAQPATHVTPADTSVTPLRVYLRERSIKEVVDRINSLKPFEKTQVSNQSYVGHWVRWSGRVLSIEPFAIGLPSGSATVTVSDSEFIYARLEYLPAARHLVEAVEEGDAIDYEARVTRVSDRDVYLTDATITLTKPVVMDVTPEYLWGLFEGRTFTQAEKLVADCIGKWMAVSGPLGDVRPSGQVTFRHTSGTHTTIYMYFRKKRWLDRLSGLQLGENITVRGRIERINSHELHLETCEFVDSPTR